MKNNKLSQITVITVIAFDSRIETKKYLKMLNLVDYKNLELVLVNNNPRNHWLENLVKKTFQKKHVIINARKNIGFAGGINLGLDHLKETSLKKDDYILLLNRDVSLKKSFLKKMLPYLKRNPKIDIASPVILYGKEKKEIWFSGGWLNKLIGFVRTKHSSLKKEKKDCDWISGCCMFIKKKVIDSLENFDEDYFLYFEDVDFCLRAKKKGFNCGVFNLPLLYHHKKDKKLNSLESFFFARNFFLLIFKNFTFPYNLTAFLGQFIVRLPGNLLRVENGRGLTLYLKGMISGLRNKTGKPRKFRKLFF